ncbi:MAG TPA: FMN-binding protein, partial [Nocardioides sp.]|nr:FMN-binding protein [Nocardioides sp.]
MKRIVLSLLSTVSAVVLLFGYHTSTSGPAATAQAPVGASLSTTSTTTSSGGAGGSGAGGSGAGGSAEGT